jgi:hypothetical protein
VVQGQNLELDDVQRLYGQGEMTTMSNPMIMTIGHNEYADGVNRQQLYANATQLQKLKELEAEFLHRQHQYQQIPEMPLSWNDESALKMKAAQSQMRGNVRSQDTKRE